MSKSRESSFVDLPTMSPGTSRKLLVHRYGIRNGSPKAYIQASLHADELPGMVVAHHLMQLLEKADNQGLLRGEIVLVPAANPIGLSQRLNNVHLGRYDLGKASNFNRDFPDLTEAAADLLVGQLTENAAENVILVRRALVEALGNYETPDELSALRVTLLRMSIDADIVLDLHCDFEAEMHIYLGTPLWPDAQDLAAWTQSCAQLLALDSGCVPFDEANSAPWWRLQDKFPDRPIPAGCLASTIELRGQSDVSDSQAEVDARAIYNFLCGRGLIDDDVPERPELLIEATPLDGVDTVNAPCPGIVVFHAEPGEIVKVGHHVADIIDPMAVDPEMARTPVYTRTDGVVYARLRDKIAQPGDTILKVAGHKTLPGRQGNLLSD